MHWELWALNTGNLIATPGSEAEVLALVRELLAKGWNVDELSLGMEDESRPVEDLQPPLEGAELAARALAAAPPDRDLRSA